MKTSSSSPGLICGLLLFLCVLNLTAATDESQLYIVYLGENRHKTIDDTHAHHHHILSNVFSDHESASNCLVHQYKHSFSGFSAMLTAVQADIISKLPGVISVFRSGKKELHTTHSWTYLGLDQLTGVWPDSKFGEDVIIGVLDSGIWPESRSFNDIGLSPVPARWNGSCVTDALFDATLCNNKLIGAKYFVDGYAADFPTEAPVTPSVRDDDGHGTHTASTAAGARVDNVDYLGLAPGTAVGGAPSARVAVYKVCWGNCSDADILAAFDEAVKDGVDILSVSLGSAPSAFFSDIIAIGGFHSTANGILVVQSAGNSGPAPGTVGSTAPWLLTVGASNINREFTSDVLLGDSSVITGLAVNTKTSFVAEELEIVSGVSVPAAGFTSDSSRYCVPDSLDLLAVAGKVVLCVQADKLLLPDGNLVNYAVDTAVASASGAGVVLVDDKFTDTVTGFDGRAGLYVEDLAASGLDVAQYSIITTYMASSLSAPTVTIQPPVTTFYDPFVSGIGGFSSRGPNQVSPFILKPDIAAPGVSILAAWTEAVTLSGGPVTPYNIISGTSMACPHVSGAAALLKSLHPDWSPSAIKSALLTTATRRTDPHSFGAGELNIVRAADPGLVYEITPNDYTAFLCAEPYTPEQFTSASFGLDKSSCPTTVPDPWNLNYPTITVGRSTVVERTVTNVGPAESSYSVNVEFPLGTTLVVEPTELTFTQSGEKLSYTVSIEVTNPILVLTGRSLGELVWSDGVRDVRTLIFVSPFTS